MSRKSLLWPIPIIIMKSADPSAWYQLYTAHLNPPSMKDPISSDVWIVLVWFRLQGMWHLIHQYYNLQTTVNELITEIIQKMSHRHSRFLEILIYDISCSVVLLALLYFLLSILSFSLLWNFRTTGVSWFTTARAGLRYASSNAW